MKNIWSTVALVFGFFYFASGINAVSEGNPNSAQGLVSGLIMILGALAYKSAKNRKSDENKDTFPSKIFESFAIIIIISMIVFSKDMVKDALEEPVPFLIIPLWAIIAYSIKAFSVKKIKGQVDK